MFRETAVTTTAPNINEVKSTMTKADEAVALYNQGFNCAQALRLSMHQTTDSTEIRRSASRWDLLKIPQNPQILRLYTAKVGSSIRLDHIVLFTIRHYRAAHWAFTGSEKCAR
jgi:hypothetical protein